MMGYISLFSGFGDKERFQLLVFDNLNLFGRIPRYFVAKWNVCESWLEVIPTFDAY